MKRDVKKEKGLSKKAGIAAVFFMMLLFVLPGSASTDHMDDIMRISLKFFPKFLAVDLDLKEKTQNGNKLPILILYSRDATYAADMAEKMALKNPVIAGFGTEVTTASKLPDRAPAAVIVIERLDNAFLSQVIDYSRQKGILLFSPFEEDIRRGVTAGISIGSRISPYFNGKALDESGVRIHPILLNSAEIYRGGAP